jgi:ABC-type lipopolysaccharide export system ATPase subunit
LATDLIVVKNLVKKFGDFKAVNGINFSVKQGESFGLLGHVAYFLVMIFAGLFFTTRWLNTFFMR